MTELTTNDVAMEELLNFDYRKGRRKNKVLRLAATFFVVTFIIAMLPLLSQAGIAKGAFIANAATPKATGRTNDLVNVRRSASVSSASLGTLRANTKVTITKEVFTSISETGRSTRWYQISGGGKSGYIRADLVKKIRYKTVKATTTDEVNYRKGAGIYMKRLGAADFGTKVKVYLPAKAAGNRESWYKVKVNGKSAYMSGAYLDFTNKITKLPTAKGRKGLSKALLKKATVGGSERIVYTFDKNNCTRKFTVTGYGSSHVPQGMAYTGSKYYFVFGMSNSQAVVTYSSKGKRLSASKFGYDMGHPNGMTWDPNTKMCYIFRGFEYRCNYWNPATNEFGKVSMPYSSSGIAYDRITKRNYVSSKTGIRVYSADGSFTHDKVFDRCSHSGTTYVQDCGAYGGYVFHAVSGGSKHTRNYLDVYRAIDGKYLGSIKVELGETESAIVNKDGYVELLINHANTWTEGVWKTPLNVKTMM